MAEEDDNLELKFRIYDGTDICQGAYPSSMTIATLKQKIATEWPEDKLFTPKSVNDVKLIHGGKVLENNKTLADCRVTFGELPGEVITMHVVVQRPVDKKKSDKNLEGMQKCSCIIL